MRTILHVGTHKTGTTTIQQFANRRAPQLREAGLWYPGYDLIGLKRHPAHHDFSHAVAGTLSTLTFEQANDFVAAIARGAGDAGHVLLSAEPIYRHVIPEKTKTTEEYWAARDAYIARLAEVTAPLEPEILIVLRRQDDFSRSLYQENVKARHMRQDFRSFLKSRLANFQYLEQINLFKKYFKIVDIAIFEDLAEDGQLLRNFFHHIGIEIGKIDKIAEFNESLPIELVEFKRQLNRADLSKQQLASISRALLDIGQVEGFPRGSDLDWIPASEMTAFMDRFAEANAQIFAMMKNPPGRDTLFPPGRVRTEVFEGLSMERFKAINALVLQRILADGAR
ncbi:hypothetical protein [Ancylobacter oerskovii]|uniref:Sulfotransferase family protein n=1 Tax=Ancylobacter oerskovii TaxID=459519 RepID=A0ABW4YVG2_9HYPH|nr:hypothetical protein [Ancylobacter oerskovii]MBS7544277.1 hypothetical protein [Ancylobacter oerskovii]